MQNDLERAKMFLPFDALNGFYDSIKEIDEENKINDLVLKIKKLHIGKNIYVKYYYMLEYRELYGKLKKVDYSKKILYIANTMISFFDIIYIE